MLAAQRKELLLDRLRVDGRLVAKDLATELGHVRGHDPARPA